MQLTSHSSDFDSSSFKPANSIDLDECKQCYIAYMQHVTDLVKTDGVSNIWELEGSLTSDGIDVKEVIVDAVAYTDLAAGMLSIRYSEKDVDFFLNDPFWSDGSPSDPTGNTGEILVISRIMGDLEIALQEGVENLG